MLLSRAAAIYTLFECSHAIQLVVDRRHTLFITSSRLAYRLRTILQSRLILPQDKLPVTLAALVSATTRGLPAHRRGLSRSKTHSRVLVVRRLGVKWAARHDNATARIRGRHRVVVQHTHARGTTRRRYHLKASRHQQRWLSPRQQHQRLQK